MSGSWQYEPAHDHGLPWQERLRSLRREAGLVSATTAYAWRAMSKLHLRGFHRLHVIGREFIPERPPFMIAANHCSDLFTVVLSSDIPRSWSWNTSPLAAGDTFFETPAVATFAAMFLNALPVWRRNCGAHALEELRRRLVEDLAIYILFPEGTRSRDGVMATFKPGIGRLVGGTEVPVLPCHLTGAWDSFPPHRSLPRPHKITLRIGPSLHFATLSNQRDDCRHIAATIESAVRLLRPEAGCASTPAS
jgi:1-acyl-sn-glycerol-3-phosphate acyltransferase